jgi:hypothetical protein
MAPASLEAVRVDALFVSDINDPDDSAVMGSLRRFGSKGCAARVAEEFDQHPDLAGPRMTWVRGAIRSIYPAGAPIPPDDWPPPPIAA